MTWGLNISICHVLFSLICQETHALSPNHTVAVLVNSDVEMSLEFMGNEMIVRDARPFYLALMSATQFSFSQEHYE